MTRLQPEDDGDLYDEVDENEYKSIVKGRLQRDDFIVDDGVTGYADNGMDDWGEGDQENWHSDEDVTSKGEYRYTRFYSANGTDSRKEKKKKKVAKPKAKPAPPPAVAPSFNDYRPKPTAANEEDFMASLLGNMENVAPDSHLRSRKRKPRDMSPPSSPGDSDFNTYRLNGTDSYADTSSDGPMEDYTDPLSDDIDVSSPLKKQKISYIGVSPAIQKFKQIHVATSSDGFDESFDEYDDANMDVFMDDDIDVKPKKEEGPVKIEIEEPNLSHRSFGYKTDDKTVADVKKKEEEAPSWLNVHASLTVASDGSLGPLASNSSGIHSSNIHALEEDGSLRFFWLDYLEQDGKVHFVGKLKDKSSGEWVSCCISVENLERNLFVLPRDKRVGELVHGPFIIILLMVF